MCFQMGAIWASRFQKSPPRWPKLRPIWHQDGPQNWKNELWEPLFWWWACEYQFLSILTSKIHFKNEQKSLNSIRKRSISAPDAVFKIRSISVPIFDQLGSFFASEIHDFFDFSESRAAFKIWFSEALLISYSGKPLEANLVPLKSLLGAQEPPKIAPRTTPGGTKSSPKWYQDRFLSLEPPRSRPGARENLDFGAFLRRFSMDFRMEFHAYLNVFEVDLRSKSPTEVDFAIVNFLRKGPGKVDFAIL